MVTATGLVAAGLTTSYTVATVYAIVINLAISYALGKILAPDIPKSARGNRGLTTIVRNPILPRRIVYGECVGGGPFIQLDTGGDFDDSLFGNELLFMIVAVSGHPLEDIIGVFFNDEYINISGSAGSNGLDANYFVNSGRFNDPDNPDFSQLIKVIKADGFGFADINYVTDASTGKSLADRNRIQNIVDEIPSVWKADDAGATRDSGTGLWERPDPTAYFDKLTNCAYVFLRMEYNRDAFTSIPKIKFHLKGKRLYNPNKDSALSSYGATGSGHSLTDPDTWEYSNDWTLCVLDYLINKDYGLGAKASTSNPDDISQNEIDWAEAISAFKASSATINKGLDAPFQNETEPTYTINGIIETGSTPISSMETLLTAGAGELIYSQGQYKIRAGEYRAPTSENDIINEDMIVSPISIKTHTPRANLFNKAAGVYVEPGYDQDDSGGPSSSNRPLFESSDFPIVDPLDSGGTNPYEDIDGEEIIVDLDFPMTTSVTMAQRLARIQLERVRRGFTLSFETTLETLKYSVGDTIYLEILNNSKYSNEAFFNRLGLDDSVQNRPDSPFGLYYKQFKILAMEYTENFTINMEIVEESENVYDWNNGYASPTENALISDLLPGSAQDPAIAPSWVVNSPDQTVVETVTGTDIRTELYWTAPVRDSFGSIIDRVYIHSYIVEYGIVTNPSAAGEARCDKWLPATGFIVNNYLLDVQGPATVTNIYIDPITEYEFRIRSVTRNGKRSAWAYYSDDIGSYFTPTVPYGATRYYIKELTGTTIQNSTGTLQIQAMEVTSAGETVLSSGNIKLYRGTSPYDEITVANGFASPSDGYTGTFDAGDINGNLLVVLSKIAPPGGTILDSTVLLDVTDGEAPLTGYLISIYGLSYSTWDGSPTLPSNPATQFRLFKGSTEVTDDSGTTFSLTSTATVNGVTASIDNTPGSTQGEINLSGTWNGSLTSWTFDGTYDSTTITVTYTIAYAQEGQPAPQVILSNPAHSIQVAAGGTEGDHDYTGSGTTIECYVGNQQLVYDSSSPYADASFRVTSAVGTNISVGTPTENANDITYGNVSNMTANQAYITYTIVVRNRQGDESTVTAVQSFSRANQGAAGEPGWGHDIVFSVTDSDTVAWDSGGSVWLADGSSYTGIGAGNTGNMTQRTYIYFDTTSPTALQTTTTVQNAVGATKVLIAVAEDTTADDAFFQVFGGRGGLKIAANEIAANTIVANNMAASFFEGQTFTGGVFQTRKPLDQLTSPYPTTTRTSMSTTGQFRIEKNDGGVDRTIFEVTDDADLFFEGKLLALVDSATDIFTSTGIDDLRDKIGVVISGTSTGGYISLTNTSLTGSGTYQYIDIVAPSPDLYYETGLLSNTLKVSINDFGTRSGPSDNPYTAPVWDLIFQYSTTGVGGWTNVPSGSWTGITGWTSNEYDAEFGEYVNSFGISASRQVSWTPTGFSSGDTIYFRVGARKTSGDHDTPRLGNVSAEETVQGGAVSELNDLSDVTITTATQGDILYYNSGNWENLAVGSFGQALTVGSNDVLEWSTLAGGVTNFDDLADVDLTGQATGGIVYKSAGGDWVDLPIGTQGQVLTTDSSGIPEWADATGGAQTPWTQDIDGGGFGLDNIDRLEIQAPAIPGDNVTFTHDGTDFNIANANVTDWNITSIVGSVNFYDGAVIRAWEDADASYTEMYHDGTNGQIRTGSGDGDLVLSANVGSSNVIIANGSNLYLNSGAVLRINNSGNNSYGDFSHDTTDFNTAFTSTTDWNITGLAALKAGNYNFNVDQTVGAGQDNYVLTYDNGTGQISLEAVPSSGTVTSSNGVDNRVAVFTTATNIEGDSNFTWDGTTVDVGTAGAGLIGTSGSTTATLMPNHTDTNTGIGWASSDELVIVAGALEHYRAKNDGTTTTRYNQFAYPIVIAESNAAMTDISGYGQFWVYSTGNLPYFTNESGEDQLIDPSISTIVNRDASLTLGSSHKGKTIRATSGTLTFNIPANATYSYPIGTMIGFMNDSGNNLTITVLTDTLQATDGTTTSQTLGDNHVAVVHKVAATKWIYAASNI